MLTKEEVADLFVETARSVYVCPHTTIYVPSCYVSAYYYICDLFVETARYVSASEGAEDRLQNAAQKKNLAQHNSKRATTATRGASTGTAAEGACCRIPSGHTSAYVSACCRMPSWHTSAYVSACAATAAEGVAGLVEP